MLLIQILNMSLTAGYCILAVLAVRLLLRRAPKKYAYLLWLVVAFRLCCPVSINSSLSLFNLGVFDQGVADGNTMAYLDGDVGTQQATWLTTGLSMFWQNTVSNPWSMGAGGNSGKAECTMTDSSLRIPLPAPENASNSVNPMQIWEAVGTLLWLTGMSVMLFCGFFSCLLLHRRLRNAVLLRENIYQSEQVCSPFILGFLHPCIYIPFTLEGQALELVLAHEHYHLQRRDHWVKLAAYLLLALHWFNPLCWVAFFMMGQDMEMSCDEHVLAERERSCKPYCNALLSFAVNRRSLGPSPLTFGESGAKKRIYNALRWKKPGIWVKVAAVGLCLLTMTACGLNPSSVLAQQGQEELSGLGQGHISDTGQNNVSVAGRSDGSAAGQEEPVAGRKDDPVTGQGEDYAKDVQGNLSGAEGELITSANNMTEQAGFAAVAGSSDLSEHNREWLMSAKGTDGIWVRTSGGKEYGVGWAAGTLVSQERKITGLDFYGAEKIQLEVSWECEQLEARVEYYDLTDTDSVLTEQRDMILPKENGVFTFDLMNIYDKQPENGREVRIYFPCDGEECLVGGLISGQGQEQKELEPVESETPQYFQGLIRSIAGRDIVIDQKKQIAYGDPEWETWAAQWDFGGYSDGRAIIDLAYEDLHALVSQDCRITILEDHWQPERNISWEELPAYIEDCPHHLLWNFTVEGNQITEITEQYLP